MNSRGMLRRVDRFLKQQAKLNDKSEKIINSFNKDNPKTEVVSLVDYLLNNASSITFTN